MVYILRFPDKPNSTNTDIYKAKLAAAKMWADLKEKYQWEIRALSLQEAALKREFAKTLSELEANSVGKHF